MELLLELLLSTGGLILLGIITLVGGGAALMWLKRRQIRQTT